MYPPCPRRWFPLTLTALVILRLMFISHDEIRAVPYDEAAYIGQAAGWYWKNNYAHWTYSRQPGYPLFLAIGSLIGVPARLVIEALWIGVSLLLIRALRAAGVRPAGQVLCFALLLFHPFPTQLFCHANSENLYTAALLVLLVSLGLATSRRDRRGILGWGLLAGLAGGVAGITRQETVLVYILIAIAGVIVLKTRILNALPHRLARRRLLLGCLLPLVIALGTEHAVRAINLARIGSYVTYDWSMPGFKALYRTMLSIPPDEPNVRIPIPADVRRRAAAASPTYAQLLHIMDSDPRCAPYHRDGEHTTGTPGEPGSYNIWLMRESAWILHDDAFKSAAGTDAFYWKVVGELRQAQARGDLPRRWAPLSFIPPEWSRLPLDIIRSLPACWTSMTEIGFGRGEHWTVADEDRLRFDAVALRRSALLRGSPAPGMHMHRRQAIERLDRLKNRLASALPAFTVLALGLAAAGAVAAQFVRRSLPPPWYTLAAMLWAAFLLRLLLVATLDATGVLASHRYLFPNAVLLVPLAVLGVRPLAMLAAQRLRAAKPA